MNDFFNDQSDAVIRCMEPTDLIQVHAIECDSQPHPWTREHFMAELQNPAAEIDVFVLDGEIAGFLCSWLIADELQIQNLATATTFRRMGVAGRLLKHVLERSRNNGMESAWLEVRTSNQAAISLYRTLDFSILSRRAEYYQDGEDALIMCRSCAGL